MSFEPRKELELVLISIRPAVLGALFYDQFERRSEPFAFIAEAFGLKERDKGVHVAMDDERGRGPVMVRVDGIAKRQKESKYP